MPLKLGCGVKIIAFPRKTYPIRRWEKIFSLSSFTLSFIRKWLAFKFSGLKLDFLLLWASHREISVFKKIAVWHYFLVCLKPVWHLILKCHLALFSHNERETFLRIIECGVWETQGPIPHLSLQSHQPRYCHASLHPCLTTNHHLCNKPHYFQSSLVTLLLFQCRVQNFCLYLCLLRGYANISCLFHGGLSETFMTPSYNNENNYLQVFFIFNFMEHLLIATTKKSCLKYPLR